MNKILCLLFVSTTVFLSALMFFPLKSTPPKRAQLLFQTKRGPVSFIVKIANTYKERAKGLMHVKDMPKNEGMLFVFKKSKDHGFWMKNTYLSLDLIFFNKDFEIVGIIEKAIPKSENLITINKPSRYVLEINGGMVERMKLRSTKKVRIIYQ